MGIDALDLAFQIEKKFHFKVEKYPAEDFLQAREAYQTKDWLGRTVERSDCRAGRVFKVMRNHSIPICAKCKFKLKGLPPAGQCPKCGMAYKDAILTWEDFQEAL